MTRAISLCWLLLLSSLVNPQMVARRVPVAAAAGGASASFTSIVDNASACNTGTTCDSSSMNVSAGDTVVCFIGAGENDTVTPTSVAATTGSANTMTINSTVAHGAPGKIIMAYKLNAAANATSTWRATFASTASFITIKCANWTVPTPANSAIDQVPVCNVGACNAASTGGTRTTANTGTTSFSSELGVCGSYEDNLSNFTAGSNFTVRGTASSIDHIIADSNLSSTGVFPNGNFATVNTTTVNYVALCATFRIS